MNDIDKQENQATETETPTEAIPEERVSEELPEEEQEYSPPGAGKSGVALVAVLALAVAGAGLGASYYLWQQLEQTQGERDSLAREMRSQQSELQSQIAAFRQELQARAGQETGTVGALEELRSQISEIRAQASRQASDGETRWIVAEVEYLMQIANRRLQLEQDVQTAVAALQMADERLRRSGDPLWVDVRKQLAVELAALRALPAVDREGLSLRLSTMIEQVASIEPVTVAAPAPESEEVAAETAREERTWETLLEDFWQGFLSRVKIQRHDRELPLFLPPDQLYFLKQNLQLQLEAARLALLRSDQQLYTESLERAAGWMAEYFDPEQSGVKALLAEIELLKQVEIQPRLPDAFGSLRLLRAKAGGGREAPQP
jgi:uroporphyrin-3 C-methyltransferase